jgi:hypothetical protein
MLSLAVLGLLNIVAGISFLVAVVSFIDYLADGFTLFTNAGSVAICAGLLCAVAYVMVIAIGFATVKSEKFWRL